MSRFCFHLSVVGLYEWILFPSRVDQPVAYLHSSVGGQMEQLPSHGGHVKLLCQIISWVSGNPVRARPGRAGGRSAAAGSASGGRQRVWRCA